MVKAICDALKAGMGMPSTAASWLQGAAELLLGAFIDLLLGVARRLPRCACSSLLCLWTAALGAARQGMRHHNLLGAACRHAMQASMPTAAALCSVCRACFPACT